MVFEFRAATPIIINASPKGKLHHPPSKKEIMHAIETFVPRYDKWMGGHYAIARNLVDSYEEGDKMGRGIAEVGCGTAILTSEIILKRMSSIFQDLAQSGVVEPTTYICLDFSEKMLSVAKANIGKCLARVGGDAEMQSKPLRSEDFKVSDKENDLIRLSYKNDPVLNVRFACKDASRLQEVKGGNEVDTVLMSYVLYWLQGLQGKIDALKAMHDLPKLRRVISIEEYPLVVRVDQHSEDGEVQELGRLIENATTVMHLAHMPELWKEGGFRSLCDSKMVRRIDEYHNMHSWVYERITAD